MGELASQPHDLVHDARRQIAGFTLTHRSALGDLVPSIR